MWLDCHVWQYVSNICGLCALIVLAASVVLHDCAMSTNISCTVVRNFCAESESKGATVDHSDSKNIEGLSSFVFFCQQRISSQYIRCT